MADPNIKIPLLSQEDEDPSSNKGKNPLEKANFFQRLLFLWIYPVVKVFYFFP